jgi:hypothetical protein
MANPAPDQPDHLSIWGLRAWRGFIVTGEEWALAASVFFSGLAPGLLGMLSTIMRPMLAAMDGRDFRNFMESFLRYAEKGWGRVFNYAWSLGMGIGPIVALVLLWDDPGSTSFVLTAAGLGVVIVGVYIVSNVWKEPLYKVILAWDPEAMPAARRGVECAPRRTGRWPRGRRVQHPPRPVRRSTPSHAPSADTSDLAPARSAGRLPTRRRSPRPLEVL